ncbi:aminoglycoside adenylyltransferase domain-containing protein [Cryptosporangium minutisporangium]|uniref:Nucleotidyltransferase domain-containing protein n=1 Tax=Cryptosporangium minutisporangium TaxID=113569 RepID=A0ABP6SPR5_9ACTN
MPAPAFDTPATVVAAFPPAAREAVTRLVGTARETLPGSLVSIVVHGSLAWGCWGPASDLDVLIVVESRAGLEEFHPKLLAEDARAPGGGFELSILSRAQAANDRHPIGYLYHFSRGRLAGQDPGTWDLSVGGNDPDLAGHLLVAHEVGVSAWGPPARRVLRRVADAEFVASVGADVLESCDDLRRLTAEWTPVPVYAVLNCARTLAWLQDRAVLSKAGGGRWLLAREARFAALATAALDEYADPSGAEVRTSELQALARMVGDRLSAAGIS